MGDEDDGKVTVDLRTTSGSYWPGHRSDPALNTKQWTLHEGAGTRQFAQRIRFPPGLFRETPRVFCALSAVDLLSDADYCVDLGTRGVTRDAMELCFETRFHSHVYSAAASWFAWEERSCARDGSDRGALWPARISTGRLCFRTFVHGGTPACPDAVAHAVQTVPLAPGAAHGRPLVLAAITGLNARHNAPLSVRVRVHSVTPAAFAVQCLLCSPAQVRSVAVAWLCVDAAYAGTTTSAAADTPAPALVRLGHVALDRAALGPPIAGDKSTGAREHVVPVTYASAGGSGGGGGSFEGTPDTVVCLSALDVPHTTDVRVKAVERERGREGFQLCVGTWCDTTVHRVEAVWLATRPGRQKLVRTHPMAAMMPMMHMGWPGIGMDAFDDDDDDSGGEDGSSDGSWSDGFDSEGSTERDSSDDECFVPPAKKPCTAPTPVAAPKDEAEKAPGAASESPASSGAATAEATPAPAAATTPTAATAGTDAAPMGECKICFDAPINTVLVPCGHLCVCLECSKRLVGSSRVCPICRTKIRKVVRTYAA